MEDNFEFKVGDIVEHVLYNGEFELLKSNNNEYPLYFNHKREGRDDHERTFTKEGMESTGHEKPSIKLIRRLIKMKEVESVVFGNIYSSGHISIHASETSAKINQDDDCLNPDNKKLIVKYFVKDE